MYLPMIFTTAIFMSFSIGFTFASPALIKRADPKGIDVSDFTTGVNFNTVKANGVSFVYIKATEGTSKPRTDI